MSMIYSENIKPHCIYSKTNFLIKKAFSPTTFDKTLLMSWKAAEKSNVLNYKISDCNMISKSVTVGKCNFVATLNEKRFSNRRKPQEMIDLNQPFDYSKFNFTKIDEKEILMTFGMENDISDNQNVIIVNASPFQEGHSLLIPELNSCHNQVMRRNPLLTALHTLLISGEENFTIAFNSLLACASVNHLHFHLWINEQPLISSWLDLDVLIDLEGDNKIFTMSNHPVHNFVVTFTDLNEIDKKFELFWFVVKTLQSVGIPHSICLLRSREGIRAILWPRNIESDYDLKCHTNQVNNICNVAVAEMAGQIFVGDKEFFLTNFTSKMLENSFNRVQLPNNQWSALISEIKKSFK